MKAAEVGIERRLCLFDSIDSRGSLYLAQIMPTKAIVSPDQHTQVGWFLHTPFPSSEIYRTLPVREEVLRAVLRADLIGELGLQFIVPV